MTHKQDLLPDLDSPSEIARLVPRFYGLVRADDLLGPIFDGVAKVNWDEHMPKLVAFWTQLILGIPGFHGSPAVKHVETSAKEPFLDKHFDRWIGLFHQTIDGGWSGAKAQEFKERSAQIAYYQAQLVGAKDWRPPVV